MSNNTTILSDWMLVCNMNYDKKFVDFNKLKDMKSPNLPVKYLGKVYIKEKNSAR